MDNKPVYKKIEAIEFGLLSPKMIKKMAVAKIVTPELYDKEGYPVDGGLMDLRLGVVDPGLRSKTTGSTMKEDLGHFGYIALARPIIHIKYITLVYDLLRSTCVECGKPLIGQDKIDEYKKQIEKLKKTRGLDTVRRKVKAILTEAKNGKKCPHCKAKQPKTTLEKPYTFFEDDRRITAVEVRTRLEKIPDDDLGILGFDKDVARPEWTILTVMPIPPVTIRPSITLETGERSEDDLTHKLGDIVRINQRLFENVNAGAPEIIIEDLWDLLQYHITTYFDNDVAQLPPARHRSGQPLKTLTERIKGKDGRIRHNLAGKRTNFSARSVISPDPMIDINEVGVPFEVARKITVPERVTEWNMDYLKEFVKRGPDNYPGANYLIRPDGRRKRLTEETIEAALEELTPGYIVERHLMDGDISIFNRQPSLHRNSMMGHRIRVMPYRTLRINPNVCAPYNADFDGDAMNIHIPQNEEAMSEVMNLMEVQTQLNSPRYGLSIIGLMQDGISGLYLLTKNDKIPYYDALRLLAFAGVKEYARLPRKKHLTGKEIFSQVLPDDFTFVSKSRDKKIVRITNGILVEGVMDKANLGEGAGLMLRNLNKRYGSKRAMEIIGQMSRMGIYYLLMRGFTVKLSETDIDSESESRISSILAETDKQVQMLIKKYEQGKIESFPGKTDKETLELSVLEVLNSVRNKVGELLYEKTPEDNHIEIMARSGARGNILNLAQISGVVGQQALMGGRINKGYNGRTLSCFAKGDLGADAHGFIRSNFKSGLQPHEFFFQAMVGRDSLMDTALRTPRSGYLYRRLANAMQDLRVEYDDTVRDSSGKIIQFRYGEDGIDVSKSEGGKVNVLRIAAEMEENS
ncbi:MAG: DNA-directed RNA polymerase subunit A' [Candidatus Woesearchaeota archaeon]